MIRVRVIPTLLLKNGGLVKSLKFKNHKYVGDPINAVKIFNEKEVDELVLLDIDASAQKRPPNISLISDIASEAFMPVAYGGGITNLTQIKDLLYAGIEKVVLNNGAFNNPELVEQAAKQFGSQAVVVSIDVKKNLFGKYKVFLNNGTKSTSEDPVEYCKKVQSLGAGEIFLNSIDRDGTYTGYDVDLIKKVCEAVEIPVIASGGAGNIEDFLSAIKVGASAVAAGSMFVFQRPHQAVLISYPSQEDLKAKLYQKI